MTGQACRRGSTRPPPVWALKSSRRWFRTCADESPGPARSRTEPLSGSSRGFGRSSPSIPSKTGLSSPGATGPGIAPLEGAPFVLGQSAPDSGVLAGLDSPLQAGLNDLASTAYGFGFFYLEKRGAGVPNREEQLGVLVQAGSAVAPSHQIGLLESGVLQDQHHASVAQRVGAGVAVVMQGLLCLCRVQRLSMRIVLTNSRGRAPNSEQQNGHAPDDLACPSASSVTDPIMFGLVFPEELGRTS